MSESKSTQNQPGAVMTPATKVPVNRQCWKCGADVGQRLRTRALCPKCKSERMTPATKPASLADAIRSILSDPCLSIDFDANRTPDAMRVRAQIIGAAKRAEAADALAEAAQALYDDIDLQLHGNRSKDYFQHVKDLRAALRRYRESS